MSSGSIFSKVNAFNNALFAEFLWNQSDFTNFYDKNINNLTVHKTSVLFVCGKLSSYCFLDCILICKISSFKATGGKTLFCLVDLIL